MTNGDCFIREISIHALREEGDAHMVKQTIFSLYFYPRPPRGGRHGDTRTFSFKSNISIHALREEGDFKNSPLTLSHARFLSTPSARRATADPQKAIDSLAKFLSTPSARRATEDFPHPYRSAHHFYPRPPRGGRQAGALSAGNGHCISIHALREEGDAAGLAVGGDLIDFYPRPPRGGRLGNASR